jgi:hypothetical protein
LAHLKEQFNRAVNLDEMEAAVGGQLYRDATRNLRLNRPVWHRVHMADSLPLARYQVWSDLLYLLTFPNGRRA